MAKKELSYAEAIAITGEITSAARSDDPRFSNAVYVQHLDGTSMFYMGAYKVELSTMWVSVITEHHGSRTLCREDCHIVAEFEQAESASLKKTLKRLKEVKDRYDKKLAKAVKKNGR